MVDGSKKINDIFNEGREFENLTSLVRTLCQGILSSDTEDDPNPSMMAQLSSNYSRYAELWQEYGQGSEQFNEISELYKKAEELHKQQVGDYEQRIKEKELEGREDIPF